MHKWRYSSLFTLGYILPTKRVAWLRHKNDLLRSNFHCHRLTLNFPIGTRMGFSSNGGSPSYHGCFNTKSWSTDLDDLWWFGVLPIRNLFFSHQQIQVTETTSAMSHVLRSPGPGALAPWAGHIGVRPDAEVEAQGDLSTVITQCFLRKQTHNKTTNRIRLTGWWLFQPYPSEKF